MTTADHLYDNCFILHLTCDVFHCLREALLLTRGLQPWRVVSKPSDASKTEIISVNLGWSRTAEGPITGRLNTPATLMPFSKH